jgi:N-acetylmuramoyl-L-alanine amidase
MTYGHADEPELYAPIVPELARLQVAFQRRGEDFLVFYRGNKIGEWPIVRSREDVPETGENPCVLVLGGNVYVPVRKLAELLPIDVKWDKKSNLVAVVPGAPKNGTAQAPTGIRPSVRQEIQAITLSGITVEQNGAGVQIHVRSSAPVRPTWLNIKNPQRIALDFPNARWADGIQVPAGVGVVNSFRTGQPTPATARLVMDVPGPQIRLTAVTIQQGEVQASVGTGAEVRTVKVDPAVQQQIALDQQIRAIIIRNRPGYRITSRGGTGIGLDGSRINGLPDGPDSGEPGDGGNPVQPPLDPPHRRIPAGDLAGKLICVDAGHGGHSAGAKGLNNLEKDLCLGMAMQLKGALQARGATVIMPRTDDSYVGLDERCQFANSRGADLFISIHCNSTPRRNSASGSQTYWRTPQSLRLAQTLHPYLLGAVRGRDGGVHNASFAVIRETVMPSVLLEIAYINNERDEQLLANPSFHGNLAENIAKGVLEYFGTETRSASGR